MYTTSIFWQLLTTRYTPPLSQYPTTILGKMCTSFMILGSLATITDQVNKLVELLSIASPYARASYRGKKGAHIIVCGAITPANLGDFFQEVDGMRASCVYLPCLALLHACLLGRDDGRCVMCHVSSTLLLIKSSFLIRICALAS